MVMMSESYLAHSCNGALFPTSEGKLKIQVVWRLQLALFTWQSCIKKCLYLHFINCILLMAQILKTVYWTIQSVCTACFLHNFSLFSDIHTVILSPSFCCWKFVLALWLKRATTIVGCYLMLAKAVLTAWAKCKSLRSLW